VLLVLAEDERAASFTSQHLYAPPQDVGFRVWYRTGAIGCFWPYRTGAMQDSGYGLPRIHLLGTWMNKPTLGNAALKKDWRLLVRGPFRFTASDEEATYPSLRPASYLLWVLLLLQT